MRCRWLHTSGDLVLIAKFGTDRIFWKDLFEGDHNQLEKKFPCIELCNQQTV